MIKNAHFSARGGSSPSYLPSTGRDLRHSQRCRFPTEHNKNVQQQQQQQWWLRFGPGSTKGTITHIITHQIMIYINLISACRCERLRRICAVQIQLRKPVTDQAGRAAPTRQHELHHTIRDREHIYPAWHIPIKKWPSVTSPMTSPMTGVIARERELRIPTASKQ